MNRNRAGSPARNPLRLVVAVLIVLLGAALTTTITATPQRSVADTPWDPSPIGD